MGCMVGCVDLDFLKLEILEALRIRELSQATGRPANAYSAWRVSADVGLACRRENLFRNHISLEMTQRRTGYAIVTVGVLTVCSQKLLTAASPDVRPETIIDQLCSDVSEDATRCATSVACLPTLKATVTAQIAKGMSSSVLRLQLTAAAAKAPVQRPSTRASSAP